MNIEEYSKIAPQYYTNEIPQLLKDVLGRSKYKTILDCGCGDGSLLYALNNQGYLKNKDVYAIDYSKSRVELVKKISSSFKVFVDSAEDLKHIEDNSIDIFVSTQVIEHVDDKKMVDTIHRVLKKNGTVYLSTVYKKKYAWYFYHNQIGWVLDPTHLREYQKDFQLFKYFRKKFTIEKNIKKLQWFPVADFFAKRIGKITRNRDNPFWKAIRFIKIPIIGYYNWEMVLKKIN